MIAEESCRKGSLGRRIFRFDGDSNHFLFMFSIAVEILYFILYNFQCDGNYREVPNDGRTPDTAPLI